MRTLLRRWAGRNESDPPAAPLALPSESTTDPVEVRRLIRRWCEERVRAEVMVGAAGSVMFVEFRETTEAAVGVAITGGDPFVSLPLAMCVVTLHADGFARVFFASLLSHDVDRSGSTLWLQWPRAIAGADGRFTFRVPVFPDSCLDAALLLGGTSTLRLTVHDISLMGMRVELSEGCPVVLSAGAAISIRLQHPSGAIDLKATVRRVEGNTYGLFFGDNLRPKGEVAAPDELIAIVRDLEHQWLRERGTR